jgi:hypothetical protein
MYVLWPTISAVTDFRSESQSRIRSSKEECSQGRHDRQITYIGAEGWIIRPCRSHGLRCRERLHIFWRRPILAGVPWRPPETWY